MPRAIIKMASGTTYVPDKVFTLAEVPDFLVLLQASGFVDIGRTEGKKGKQFVRGEHVEAVQFVADATEIPPDPMAPIEAGA